MATESKLFSTYFTTGCERCVQSEQLTTGDLWLKCMLDTEKLDSTFAKQLVQCMKGHQHTLFENDAFVAALFVDTRYSLDYF